MLLRQRIWSSVNLAINHHRRLISSTSYLSDSWMDKIKGVISGQNSASTTTVTHPSSIPPSSDAFTLLRFAEELGKARKLGTFKQHIMGKGSEAAYVDAFLKHEAILRYLGGFDPSGENLKSTQKQEAAKKCNSSIVDVENALAKFTWAKEAQKKLEKLKEEGKPIPTSMAEVQKLMGNTPMDVAQANLAKSGQISRNALCPCGSKKRYKRCCGKD